MKNKFCSPLILLTIIIVSFPSICFSELKTVDGEYCDSYLGSMKDKKGLEGFRKTVRTESIKNGLAKLITPQSAKSGLDLLPKTLEGEFTDKCISHVISNYLEKVVVVSHTEKRRKICDKVRITLDPEVTKKYLNQEVCEIKEADIWGTDICVWDVQKILIGIMIDNSRVGKTDKINIGLIIETKIPDIDEYKRQQLENEEENQLFKMTEINKDQYTVVDRRHLSKILEEQKLQSSGITDSDTVKVGKLLNLDIIVLRLIYENSKVTKVLKVDTGEVLLFKTYDTKKDTKEEGWIYNGKTKDGDFYYDNSSIMKVSPNIVIVWSKCIFPKGWIERNKDFIQNLKRLIPQSDYNKLHHRTTLYEIDCLKNTYKNVQYVDYNDEDKSLFNFHDSLVDKEIYQIIPDTILDILRRKICD